jgi:hypothetical protein
MKKIGYRILEFGRFNWESIMSGFNIYKDAYGHIDIPYEFVVDEDIISLGIGFDERHEGILILCLFWLSILFTFCNHATQSV